MRRCSRRGCEAPGSWRPVLFLVLADHALGYRVPLPVVICDVHRLSIARLFGSHRGRAFIERALQDRIEGARPSWSETLLLFSSEAHLRAPAALRA